MLGLRCKVLKQNESSLKCIYFAYTHSYVNYENIAWASTYRTKLKEIPLTSKACCIVFLSKDPKFGKIFLRIRKKK